MRSLAHCIVTLGPIGYMPVPGTLATVACLPLCVALFQAIPVSAQLVCALISTAVALLLLHIVRDRVPLDADPRYLVIDELVGSLWASIGVSWDMGAVVMAIVVFRFFDVTKWGGGRAMERLPGPMGIIADDLLAGLYACLAVHLYQFVCCGL